MDSVDCPLNIICNIQRGESLQKGTLRNKHVENEEKLMIQDDIAKMWNNGKRTFKISIQRRMWKKPINASNLTFKIYSRMLILLAVISGRAVYATQRDSSFKIMDENSSNTIVGHGIVNKINSNVTQKNNSNRFTGTLNLLDDNTALASATVRATNLNITSSNSSSLTTTTSTGNIDGRNFKAPITAVHRNTIEVSEENKSGPYFDKSASKNITALLGKTAYLNCRVKNFGNKTMLLQVSWVRHRDIHLLTVGRYTYTSDQRFRAIHQPQTEDWILQIKYPQHRDSGIYECQVSTTPHMSHYIHLNVVEPSTEIIGAPDLYIESGSTINLTCVILNSPEPPAYIFWNHNSAIINYDSPRGGVSVVTNKGETTTSFLLIKAARPTDSGQYQCNPSNSKSKGVTVHVLNGEFPAAMQRAGQAHHQMSPNHYLLVCISTFLSAITYIKVYQRIPNSVGHI